MNERIKDVCEQAKAYANESTEDFTGDEPVAWMDYYTEKFAELIVKECAEQVDLYFSEFYNGTAEQRILKHFGIEE